MEAVVVMPLGGARTTAMWPRVYAALERYVIVPHTLDLYVRPGGGPIDGREAGVEQEVASLIES